MSNTVSFNIIFEKIIKTGSVINVKHWQYQKYNTSECSIKKEMKFKLTKSNDRQDFLITEQFWILARWKY